MRLELVARQRLHDARRLLSAGAAARAAAVSVRRRPSPLLYLLNPTAGLFDGDGQLVSIDAHAGTRAVVVGQSATRIHPALRGFSTQ